MHNLSQVDRESKRCDTSLVESLTNCSLTHPCSSLEANFPRVTNILKLQKEKSQSCLCVNMIFLLFYTLDSCFHVIPLLDGFGSTIHILMAFSYFCGSSLFPLSSSKPETKSQHKFIPHMYSLSNTFNFIFNNFIDT